MNHSERERMFEELFHRHKAPVQRLRFQRECRPLIDRLLALLETMEDE